MIKKRIKNSEVIPIVGDGALISPDVADRRLIPVLILDCVKHGSFKNLINIHQNTPPGDVTSTWAFKRFYSKNMYTSF